MVKKGWPLIRPESAPRKATKEAPVTELLAGKHICANVPAYAYDLWATCRREACVLLRRITVLCSQHEIVPILCLRASYGKPQETVGLLMMKSFLSLRFVK